MSINIEELLKEYNKIILVNDITSQEEKLWQHILHNSKMLYEKKVLFLISEDMPCNQDICMNISKQDADELKRLYLMYEFDDNFQLFSSGKHYGSLLNYVKTGVLTMDECMEAMFM